MTDKLPRESHVKQLLVDSLLCVSFDRPVTDNCPILVSKKCTRLEKYYQRLRAVIENHIDFNEHQKDTSGQPEHPSCAI